MPDQSRIAQDRAPELIPEAPSDEPQVVRVTHRSCEVVWARSIVAVTLVTWAVSRAFVIASAVIPKGPDVIGPWAVAFSITGAQPAIDMGSLPPYSITTGALLAPLVPLVEDPRLRYRVALGFLGLVVLGGSWLIAATARRLLRLGPMATAGAFATVTLLTTVTFSSSFTWSEPVTLVWLAIWVSSAAAAAGSPRIWPSVAVAVFASTAVPTHGRLTLVPVAWIAFVVGSAILDHRAARRTLRSALLLAGSVITAGIVTYLIAKWLRTAAINSAWSNPSFGNQNRFLGEITNPGYWTAVAKGAAGQLWYVLSSTAGLAAVGVWAIARVGWKRDDPDALRGQEGPVDSRRRGAIAALLGLGAVAATSILWVSLALMRNPPSRPDYLVYGRYIDPVAVILAAIGTASLLTKVIRGTPKVLLTALTGSALLGVAVRYFRDGFDTSPFAVNEGVIAGVASWPFDRAGLDVVRWTAVAVAAGALILLSTLYHRRATAATVMVLLVLGCASGTRRAVVEHAMWDNSVLFEHYPPAPEGYETVAVAANARGGTAYNFNAPTQHYALAPLGWNFQTIDGDGDWLASHPPDDAGMLVMLSASGPPKGGWCHMPPYANVIIWARLDVVLPGIDDGPCTLSG